jgi:hypothetical protein
MQHYWKKSDIDNASNASTVTEAQDPLTENCYRQETYRDETVYLKWEGNDKQKEDTWTKKEVYMPDGTKITTTISGARYKSFTYPESVEHFLSEYYDKAHMTDIQSLKSTLLLIYNQLVDTYPTVDTFYLKGCISKDQQVVEKLSRNTIERTLLSQIHEEFTKITDFSWLQIYFELRSFEERIAWTKGAHKQKMRRLKKIFKYYDKNNLDNGRALCYINNETKKVVYEKPREGEGEATGLSVAQQQLASGVFAGSFAGTAYMGDNSGY